MSETLPAPTEAQRAVHAALDQITAADCDVWFRVMFHEPLGDVPRDQAIRLLTLFNAMRLVEDDDAAHERDGGAVVYAIRGGSLTKIGTTKNLTSRLGSLRAASPSPLELLGSCAGSNELEKSLHGRFAAWRHHGEWFDLDAEATADLLALFAEVGP